MATPPPVSGWSDPGGSSAFERLHGEPLPLFSRHDHPLLTGQAQFRTGQSKTPEAVVISLRVPGHLAYKELATRVVTTACKLARIHNEQERPLPEEFTHQAVSAVGEAFNNVVLHGYEDRTQGDILFEVTTLEDRIEITVKDYGRSFNPDDAPEPDLGELPESGMGLFIIRAFVDELTYEAGSPNCLRMVKRFDTWLGT